MRKFILVALLGVAGGLAAGPLAAQTAKTGADKPKTAVIDPQALTAVGVRDAGSKGAAAARALAVGPAPLAARSSAELTDQARGKSAAASESERASLGPSGAVASPALAMKTQGSGPSPALTTSEPARRAVSLAALTPPPAQQETSGPATLRAAPTGLAAPAMRPRSAHARSRDKTSGSSYRAALAAYRRMMHHRYY